MRRTWNRLFDLWDVKLHTIVYVLRGRGGRGRGEAKDYFLSYSKVRDFPFPLDR